MFLTTFSNNDFPFIWINIHKWQTNWLLFENNAKGIQISSKRIKLFEYLKNYITSNAFIFLQEKHSTNNDKKWQDEFKGQLSSFCGKANTCGFVSGVYRTKTFELIDKISDKLGRILLLELKIHVITLVLVSIYNANTATAQIQTLLVLNNVL